MPKKKDLIYDSETGDVLDPSSAEGIPAVEPLRIPGIVEQFMSQYIPAPDERTATDVLTLGELRSYFSAWMMFNSRTDLMQEYLDALASEGYFLQDTSSGPAMCLIAKSSPRVISPYQEAEEIKIV